MGSKTKLNEMGEFEKKGLIKKDSKKVDYFIPETTISPEMQEEIRLNKLEKEKEAIKDINDFVEGKLSETEGYNKDISINLPSSEDLVNSFDLLGNYALIRPFKIETVEKTESGLILLSKGTQKTVDDRTNKVKVEEMAFPYQMRGIVVKYGTDVTEEFKTKFPIGSLIGFMPQPVERIVFYVDANEQCSFPDVEKYFTVKVPVAQFERKYNVNKYVV